MKPSSARTTSAVRSMDVPAGSSYFAVKIVLSDGGKKMRGMKPNPASAAAKTAATTASETARWRSAASSVRR